MAKRNLIAAAALAGAVLGAGAIATPARASQIFIQQSGASATGGDPNIITNVGSFVVGNAGNHSMLNPLLVIVGVYNGNGVPSISYPTSGPSKVRNATVGTYGLTHQTATFTSGTAFAALGLAAGGSENFGNWSGADVALGLAAPTSFTLYAFALETSLAEGSPITIGESGAANGSFVIAYSCAATNTGKITSACQNGEDGQTVFTNTGLLDARPTPVPEPGSLLLLGTGLYALGFAGALRRRKVI